MKMKAIIFLVALIQLAIADNYVNTTIGATPVDIAANTVTNVYFTDTGITVAINPSENGNFSINYFNGALIALPTGYSDATFTNAVLGYNINVFPNTIVLNQCLITTGGLSSTSMGQASNASVPVLLQYDGYLQYFSQATFSNYYNSTTGAITANLAQSGTYIPAIHDVSQVFVPSVYNYKQLIAANQNTSVEYPSGFSVGDATAANDLTLRVSSYASNNGVGNANYAYIGIFWNFNVTGGSTSSFSANLIYNYAQVEIDSGNLNETTLRFFYYDGTNWRTSGNATVDTLNNKVTQSVEDAYIAPYVGVYGLKNGETAQTTNLPPSGNTTGDGSLVKPLIFATVVAILFAML